MAAIIAKVWDGAAYQRVRLPSPAFAEVLDALSNITGGGGAGGDAARRQIRVRAGAGGGSAGRPRPLDEETWLSAITEAAEKASAEGTSRLTVHLLCVPSSAPAGPAEEAAAEAEAEAEEEDGRKEVEQPSPSPTQASVPEFSKEKEKRELRALNILWLPMLVPGSPSKAVVLECRSFSTSLRVVGDGGRLDNQGHIGKKATFLARCVGKTESGGQVLTFSSSFLPGSFLAPRPCTGGEPPELGAAGSGGEDCHFEAVCHWSRPLRAVRALRERQYHAYGVALRHVASGRFVDITEAGCVQLVDPPQDGEEEEVRGELFVCRYQPKYDEAWKEDGQYEGRRRWISDPTKTYYTFEDFIAFAGKPGVQTTPHGEKGLIAAKFFWAASVEEGASEEVVAATQRLKKAMKWRRQYSLADRTSHTFSEMLAFVEARNLRYGTKTDVEMVMLKFRS